MENSDILSVDVSKFDVNQRFELIEKAENRSTVLEYLTERLKTLTIEIGADPEKNIIDLMKRGGLVGWCWQTTESAVVFLNDDACIERGHLKGGYGKFGEMKYEKKLWHSWICFSFEDTLWVFDPCLGIIVEKDIYYHIFEISKVDGRVSAKEVKEDLITRLLFSKDKGSTGEKKSALIWGNEDVNAPMYRTDVRYTALFNNGSISNLTAHYYFNG